MLKAMRGRLQRLLITIGLGLLLVATVSLSSLLALEKKTHALEIEGQNHTQAYNDLVKQQLKSKLSTTEKEIAKQTLELEAKKAELDKAKTDLEKTNQDLSEKTKSLDSANKKIKDQESQISANSTELSRLRSRPPLFTFNVEASHLVNSEQKKQDVQDVVSAAYDTIVDIYSKPYLLHQVTISFVDSFSNPNAAAEIVIENGKDGLSLTIKLKDFDKNNFNDVNAIIHEIIHSFHGLAVLSPTAYEEGITVAATDAVMEKLSADGKIPSFKPLYIRISSSQYVAASPLPANDTTFYTSDDVADYYQVAGYGWYQIYKADTSFFKTFNEKIYDKKRAGEEITTPIVLQALHESIHGSVQGKSADDWLKTAAFALK